MRGAVAREARYGGQGEQVRVWHQRGRAGRRVAHPMFTATRNPARPSGRTAARAAAKARDARGAPTPPHIVAALARPPKPTIRHQQRAVRRRCRWRVESDLVVAPSSPASWEREREPVSGQRARPGPADPGLASTRPCWAARGTRCVRQCTRHACSLAPHRSHRTVPHCARRGPWPGAVLCAEGRARTNALLERRALELLTHARLHVRVLVAAPRASTRQKSCAVRRTHVALWPRTPHCSAALADHQCDGCGG